MSKGNSFVKSLLILLVLAFGLKLWYDHLDEGRQRFIRSLIRQIPELPGRYSV